MMCAESPKPYSPIRCASPAARSVGHAVLGVTPVEVVAGEARVHAQVLEAAAAEAAGLVDVTKPGNANALARLEAVRALPGFLDVAYDHVPDYQRQFWRVQLAAHDVQVGAADGTDRDLDEDLALNRDGNWHVFEAERLVRRSKPHRPHGAPIPTLPGKQGRGIPTTR